MTDTDLTFGEIAVAMYLLLRMSDKAMWTRPGHETIARELKTSRRSVIRHLSGLEKKGWIEVRQRYHNSSIYIAKCPLDGKSQSDNLSHSLSSQCDNLSSQSAKLAHREPLLISPVKEKSTKKEKSPPKRERFTPPSVEQVRQYATEKNLTIDPEHFVDHYTANGWKVGRNPMKDWQATVRNWSRRDAKRNQNPGDKTTSQTGRQTAAERNADIDDWLDEQLRRTLQ